jgi:hypothetical protein
MAADVELRLISKVIRERNLAPLLALQVDDTWWLGDEALQLWRFTKSHYMRYGECPSAVSVKHVLPGYRLLLVDDALEYLLDEFIGLRRRAETVEMLQDAAELVGQGNHEGAIAIISGGVQRLTDARTADVGANPELARKLKLLQDTSRNGEDLGDLPKPMPLIENTIDRNTITFLVGWTGTAKTWIGIDWAMHVCNGRAWNGRQVQQGKVLYVLAEGAFGIEARLDAWKRHSGGDASNLTVKYAKVHLVEDAATIALWAKEEDFALVVIDTLARNKDSRLDESSATDMGKVIAALDDIRMANETCVLVIHHTGKDKVGPRGSSTFDCDADTIYTSKMDHRLVTLERTKRRDGPLDDQVTLELVADPEGGCHLDGDTERAVELASDPVGSMTPTVRVLSRTLGAFGNGEAPRQAVLDVAAGPGLSRDHAIKTLTQLVKKGLMSKRSVGRKAFYRVTAEGEAWVPRALTSAEHTSSTPQNTPTPDVGCSPPPLWGGSTAQVEPSDRGLLGKPLGQDQNQALADGLDEEDEAPRPWGQKDMDLLRASGHGVPLRALNTWQSRAEQANDPSRVGNTVNHGDH